MKSMESMICFCFVFVTEAELLPKTGGSHWDYLSTWDLRFFGFTYIWILDGSQLRTCCVDFARGQCLLFWYIWVLENWHVFISFLQCESRQRIMIRINRQIEATFYYKCFLYMSIYVPCLCLVPTLTPKEGVETPRIGLHRVVSFHGSAGNWTWALLANWKCT